MAESRRTASLPRTKTVVLAAAAHPDDIEFMMAGTLLLLQSRGAEIHMFNLANGCCGTRRLGKDEIVEARWKEALESASIAGATLHPPITDDGLIFYDREMLSRAASIVRRVRPSILLVPSPEDYMEDHQNTSRILVTAAFTREMPHFPSEPHAPPWEGPTAIYHSLPHGLLDSLRRRIRPEYFVNIEGVLAVKRQMLSCHRSQEEWLESSQGITFVEHMEETARYLGTASGQFRYAEGWRRHSHMGFSKEGHDPLRQILGDLCWIDADFTRTLNGA